MHRPGQPSGNDVSARRRHRCSTHVRAKKVLSKCDRGDHPLAATPIRPEASSPIEIGGTAFQGDGQIREPERPDHSVPERMDRQNPEVIFERGHPPAVGEVGLTSAACARSMASAARPGSTNESVHAGTAPASALIVRTAPSRCARSCGIGEEGRRPPGRAAPAPRRTDQART